MANSDLTVKVLARGLAAFVVVLLLAIPAALAAPPADRGSQSSTAQGASADDKNAAKKCKAERAARGTAAFNQEHGTNANKRNAHGKCVSGKAEKSKDEDDDEQDEDEKTSDAAKKCKAERATRGTAAFGEGYGTNPNNRNAFGKCVSKHAKKEKPARP